jgi:hypothetical protein
MVARDKLHRARSIRSMSAASGLDHDLGCAIGWDAYCALGRSDMSWLLHLVYR